MTLQQLIEALLRAKLEHPELANTTVVFDDDERYNYDISSVEISDPVKAVILHTIF